MCLFLYEMCTWPHVLHGHANLYTFKAHYAGNECGCRIIITNKPTELNISDVFTWCTNRTYGNHMATSTTTTKKPCTYASRVRLWLSLPTICLFAACVSSVVLRPCCRRRPSDLRVNPIIPYSIIWADARCADQSLIRVCECVFRRCMGTWSWRWPAHRDRHLQTKIDMMRACICM